MEKGTNILHYTFVEKLGEGGMGVVYKARDTKLDRTVALKFLPSTIGDSEEEVQRFNREAKTAAALNHPHICTIHQIEEHEGRWFIAMEYVEGQTLKEKLQEGALPVDLAIQYALQIAGALGEAHDRGIIHRDIKPENIMIDQQNRVKVMDFGLAKINGSVDLTKTGSTLGTVPYMSPEQAKGEQLDHRTDIWSTGVILYEMLSGERPFKSEYDHALIYSIINEEIDPVSELPSTVPLQIRQCVARMLEKNPKKRLSSAEELKESLKNAQSPLAETESQSLPHSSWWKQKSMIAVQALAVILVVLAIQFWPESRAPLIRSIAVLPLDNYSESEEDYFVDGMTEALITELSKVDELRVISRTSSMRYKDSDKSLPEIAQELNVDAIVEGSVLRTGNQVRITAQLINAMEDEHIWADQFDRNLENILKLHSDVAREIAEQVDLTLTSHGETVPEEAKPVNPDVYELYLRGRQLAHHWTEDGLTTSIDLLQQAIELDSTYAPAYGAIGLAYTHLSHYRYPHDVWPVAEKFARQAIEIDDKEPNAHMTLGTYYFIYIRNWQKAKQHLRRAIELEPNSAEARAYYSWYLCAMSLEEKCVQELETARQIDPLSVTVREMRQAAFILLDRYDDAIADARSTLEFASSDNSILFMGTAFALKGDSLNAVKTLEPIMSRTNHLKDNGASPPFLAWGTYAYAEIGATEIARQYLQQIIDITEERHVCAYDVGAVYGRLGEIDEAFVWLDRAIEESAPCLPNSKIDPRLDPLRDDPRFDDFLVRAGF